MSIITTENLTKVYGKGETAVTALDHVSLKVNAGEFVAVMGPSGCGKSTLLHLLGGLDRPSEGGVSIDGTAIADMKDDDLTRLRRRKMGFVFQFYNLIPVLNAVENAALPVTLDGVKPGEAKKRATEWLERFGMGDRLSHRPDQLSGWRPWPPALCSARRQIVPQKRRSIRRWARSLLPLGFPCSSSRAGRPACCIPCRRS